MFGSLLPGVYAVREVPPSGWSVSTVSCSNGSDPASIRLAQGEEVTCTFTSRFTSPTGLPVTEEPTLNRWLFLPMVNR